jgi:hemoglobin
MTFDAITEESIRLLVDNFYADVRRDPVLGPVFERALHDRWEEHMPRMYAFWGKILLDAGNFQGNVFGKHMVLSGIAPEHFRRWLSLFKANVGRLFGADASAEILEVADRIAGSLQLGFFGERPVSVHALQED